MTPADPVGRPATPPSSRAPRRDALRNRRKLLQGVGAVLRTKPDALSIPSVAETAGLSVATAYRYFNSLDELLSSYMREVVIDLRDYSHDCPKSGTALFEDVAAHWMKQLAVHGPAMIQLRSHTGFLRRLADNDDLLLGVRDAWERPIRGVMRQLDIPDEHFNHALFLYNILFDPRDVLDLIDSGLTEEETVHRLVGTFYGALQGWAKAAASGASGGRARGNRRSTASARAS